MSFPGHGRLTPSGDRIVLEFGRRRTTISLPRFGGLIVSAMLGGLVAWSVSAAGYIMFHDTVVAELRRGAHAAQIGYEAQIDALSAELERVRTRRLAETAGVNERLAELARRQQMLERRQIKLSELAAPVTAAAPGQAYSAKPIPLDGQGAPLDDVGAPQTDPLKLSSTLGVIEQDQTRALDDLAAKTGERRRKLERVYEAVGARKPTDGDGARGGPFEPLPVRALTFDARVEEVAAQREAVEALTRGLNRVPVRTPAPGASISSGFGARSDPFLGRPAFHAGVDFEEHFGETVRATAAGRVTNASFTGGYGNMVEIDHGGGLTTRFGHLSAISVTVGQIVKVGAVLGRVGSTGRSTGPHLHYETRIDGEAVDPIRFLNAGRMLASVVN